MALPPVVNQAPRENGTQSPPGVVATVSSAGTKTDTPLIDTPQAISVITRTQLDQQNFQTLAQALQYVPGVATGTRGGYDARFDYALIRGFNETVQGDYRDGLRENVGLGSFFSYFGTEPYGLERVDVVRGPASVLYGLDAPGGLINRISKTPISQPFADMQVTIGSDNFYQGQFDFGGPVQKDSSVDYRMVGLFRKADSPFPNVPNDRIYLAPSLTWKIDPDTTFTLLTNFEKDHTGVGTVARNSAGNLTSVYLDDPAYSHFDREQVQVGYEFAHRFNDIFTFRQNFRYGRVDTDYRAINQIGATGVSASRYALAVQEALNTYALDNQLEAKFATGPVRQTVLFGLDGFRSTLKQDEFYGVTTSLNLLNPIYNQNIPEPSIPLTRTHQELNQYGIYLQDQLNWNRWYLTLGGRQDLADSQTVNQLTTKQTTTYNTAHTGRVGLLYASSIGLSPYVSASTSFVPNLGTSRLGTSFSPTTGVQEEVGIKYQPPGYNSFATLSLFNINQRNVLVTDPVNANFSAQTGEIRSRGIELEERAELGHGLSAIATGTYDDVRNTVSSPANTVGKIPIATPTWLASTWLDYTQQTGDLMGFGLGGGIRYTGPTFADAANTVHNPAAFYVDLEAHYDLASWRLQLNATNVTGRRFATCYTTICTENEDRLILATLKKRW